MKTFRGIASYSTAQTSNAVYIIGGFWTRNIVAKYMDNEWLQKATLNQGRAQHGTITFEGQTMIIGGLVNGFGLVLITLN